jgi:hypothetical protein
MDPKHVYSNAKVKKKKKKVGKEQTRGKRNAAGLLN